MNISGCTFVVTGAGNGIGREVTLELLRRGANVAGVDISLEGMAETARLGAAGERFSSFAVDLTDRDAVSELPELVSQAHGNIDGLVNVAGIIQRFVPVTELTLEDIERVIDVNLWGTININKVFLDVLIARPQAALVNVSSMGGFIPFPGQTAYSASKAAVKLWTEGLQAELAETNVAVTIVFPGAIATDIARQSGVSDATPDATDSPIKMTPADVAGQQIVAALAAGTPRLRVGSDAKLLDRLQRLMPTRSIRLIAKKMAAAAAAGSGGP